MIDRPAAVVLMLKGRPLPVRLWLAYRMYRRYFGPWQPCTLHSSSADSVRPANSAAAGAAADEPPLRALQRLP
jgi:hypothetical protein